MSEVKKYVKCFRCLKNISEDKNPIGERYVNCWECVRKEIENIKSTLKIIEDEREEDRIARGVPTPPSSPKGVKDSQ
jgi:hypothetical protein